MSLFSVYPKASYRNFHTSLTCHADKGSGSDRRRKAIINGKLNQEALFTNLMRQFRRGFHALAATLQEQVRTTVAEQLDVVKGTLDIIQSENVARESERDPAFRQRVATELTRAREVMDRVGAVIV